MGRWCLSLVDHLQHSISHTKGVLNNTASMLARLTQPDAKTYDGHDFKEIFPWAVHSCVKDEIPHLKEVRTRLMKTLGLEEPKSNGFELAEIQTVDGVTYLQTGIK